MSEYNRQQRDAVEAARRGLEGLASGARARLLDQSAPYLAFRERAALFQAEHFGPLCRQLCFSRGLSACCGREGILTFFADVVIDLLAGGPDEAGKLLGALERDRRDGSCVYLSDCGCTWALPPVACAMFLCDEAKGEVFGRNPSLAGPWEEIRLEERRFTRPDRPVLFDDLERFFIDLGLESPLMYFHTSPGLLRLKARHGVGRGRLGGRPSPRGGA